MNQTRFECPACGGVSRLHHDVRHGFCPRCSEFTRDPIGHIRAHLRKKVGDADLLLTAALYKTWDAAGKPKMGAFLDEQNVGEENLAVDFKQYGPGEPIEIVRDITPEQAESIDWSEVPDHVTIEWVRDEPDPDSA